MLPVSREVSAAPRRPVAPVLNEPLFHRLAPDDPKARACLNCSMRGTALFGVLRDRDLDDVHSQITQVHFDAGDLIYECGRQGDAVYTLRSGIVRFERASAGGDRRILRLAGCGDLLGQELLLQRPHVDDAIACTAVSMCRLPVAAVMRLGSRHPPVLRELMERWQQALEDSQSWVAELSTGTARRRVLKLLEKLAHYGEPGQPVWLPKREEMGDMLNLTIETASRQISQLRREGVLRGVTRRYARLDPVVLRQALEREEIAG